MHMLNIFPENYYDIIQIIFLNKQMIFVCSLWYLKDATCQLCPEIIPITNILGIFIHIPTTPSFKESYLSVMYGMYLQWMYLYVVDAFHTKP